MRFVLLNESTAMGNAGNFGGPISAAQLADYAEAFHVQMNRDVGPAWGGVYGVRAGVSKDDVQVGEVVCAIVDALPHEPDAVAFHDVEGAAVPAVWLARVQCATLDDVTLALSHELCETAGDPAVNVWRDAGDGWEYAQELCDAVQESSYQLGGVKVANFVLPGFFAPAARGPFDLLGAMGAPVVTEPFQTASGGYQIRRQGAGARAEVFGDVGAHRLAKKRSKTSRTWKRGVRL